MTVPNVLAERYASAEMRAIFDPVGRIVTERRLWVAVMKAQAALGLAIPAEDIASYEAVVDRVDLASIEARERISRHDVKARIDEFSALAGAEHAHKAMTSRCDRERRGSPHASGSGSGEQQGDRAAGPLGRTHRGTRLVGRRRPNPQRAGPTHDGGQADRGVQ